MASRSEARRSRVHREDPHRRLRSIRSRPGRTSASLPERISFGRARRLGPYATALSCAHHYPRLPLDEISAFLRSGGPKTEAKARPSAPSFGHGRTRRCTMHEDLVGSMCLRGVSEAHDTRRVRNPDGRACPKLILSVEDALVLPGRGAY